MSSTTDTEIAPNAKRLLWAGFMAILAAGVGFAIRGGIFDNWGGEYGFTALELGAIGDAVSQTATEGAPTYPTEPINVIVRVFQGL